MAITYSMTGSAAAQTDLYRKIFLDMPIEAAERRVHSVLEISSLLTKEFEKADLYEKKDRWESESLSQAMARVIHNLLGEFDADRDTKEIFFEAVDALSEKSGKDYMWLMAVYGKNPNEYASEHPELEKDKLEFLCGSSI
jgi:hypothetical protein